MSNSVRLRKKKLSTNSEALKLLERISGVYEIVHKKSKKRYVGSSSVIGKRLRNHLFHLKRGTHICTHLQRVWNKYGEITFEFYLVEECSTDDLAAREQYHMDKPHRMQLMNIYPTAGSALGYKHSNSTRHKMSKSAIKIADDPEERKRRSDRARKQHAEGKFGRSTWSEETRKLVTNKVIKASNKRYKKGITVQDTWSEVSRQKWITKIRSRWSKEMQARMPLIPLRRQV